MKIKIGQDGSGNTQTNIFNVREQKKHQPNSHNLPNSGVAQFVGRDQVLTQLHDQLQQNDRVAISTLTGMGGIGKSELALQYGWQEWRKKTYRGGICWLNVADSDPGLGILSFAGSYLGLTLPEEGELVERVRNVWQGWLKNEQDQTLIIFDDVRDYQQVKNYLPPQADQRFKVIITTRLKELSAKIQTLHVDVLKPDPDAEKPDPALDLLRSYVTDGRIDDQLEQAKLLCRDLGYLPLALELVARLLRRRTNWTIAKIREKLAENGLADQSLIKNPKFDSEMTAELGVKAAFDLSWQELDNEPNSQKLAMYLSLFALAPLHKILIDPLFSEEDEDEDEIEEWLTDSLVHLNLVKSLGNGWYELHTLIRHYLRDKLEESAVKETAKKAYVTVMVNVAGNINQTLNLEDIANIEPFVDHLKIAAEELNQWLGDEDLAWFFTGLSNFYRAQGLYSDGIFYCEKCLILSEQRLDIEHLNIAVTLNNLGSLYEAQGKYEKAESFYLRSLAIREKQLGENHPAFATSLNNLALLYKYQGKYKEAESLYRRSLTIREKQLGETHPHVAQSLNNLAGLYMTYGKYVEAEPLYLRSFTIKENQLEKNYHDIAISLNNLAEFYRCQGKYEEAEDHYQKVLIIQEEKLVNNHPDVATTLNNLAEFYRCQGKYEESEDRYQKALIIQEEKLGDNHPYIATTLNNLAELYRCQGRYKEAESLSLRSLAIQENQLEQNHPDVGRTLNTLALLYKTQGKYAEAEPLYKRALQLLEQRLGIAHPITMTVRGNYAQCLKDWVASRQQTFPL